MRLAAILLALTGCATAAPVATAPDVMKPMMEGESCHKARVDPAGALKAFDHKPAPGEKAVCPVSGEVFIVDADTKVTEYGGKYYAFCCPDCPGDFHPEKGKPQL